MSQLSGLVVEDEWLLRLELTEELTADGWALQEAGSGEEALELIARLKAENQPIAFVVTDIRLGGSVTGWDVAEACRSAWPHLPVIYVSANPIMEDRRVEGSVFLGKPVMVDMLKTLCRQMTSETR